MRLPSRRRRGPGRTICPLVDTLVCMLRQSYRSRSRFGTAYRERADFDFPGILKDFPRNALFKPSETYDSLRFCPSVRPYALWLAQHHNFDRAGLSKSRAGVSLWPFRAPSASTLARTFYISASRRSKSVAPTARSCRFRSGDASLFSKPSSPGIPFPHSPPS